MTSGLVVHRTPWSLATDGNVTIPATTAGNTLILTSSGGAIVSSSGFTTRTTYPGGGTTVDLSISDRAATAGEVSIHISSVGDPCSGEIIECIPGLTFVAAGNPNAGNSTTTSSTLDNQLACQNSVTLTSGQGLLVSTFLAITTSTYAEHGTGTVKWRQHGPYGVANNMTSTGKYVCRVAVSDVDSTSAYPAQNSAGVYNATSVWFQGGDSCYVAQVLYSNTSGLTANPDPVNPIVAENSLPGTLAANWALGGAATNATIAAYTHRPSYAPGDTVEFKVDSTGHTAAIRILRQGFYGYGTVGARNVLGNQAGDIAITVVTQPSVTVDTTVHGHTEARWTTNATWTIPDDACPGTYTFLARRTDVGHTGEVCQGIFTVRGNITGGHVVANPSPTWQAYNLWGLTTDHGVDLGTGTWTGADIYQTGSDGASSNFAHRSTAVSYDRPYATQSMRDMTFYFDTDGLIQFMEAQGVNLGYCDEWDLENDPTLLMTAKSYIPIGHHEYVSTNMYDAYEMARDAGVNALWASANTAGWRVRFDSMDTDKMLMICYKDSGTRDVSAPAIGTGYDPGDSNGTPQVTGTWRDSHATNGVTNPDRRRENTLTGQIFGWSGPINDQLHFDAAHKSHPVWRNSASILALTGSSTYESGVNDSGFEIDYADGSAGQPANLVVLFQQSFSSTFGSNTDGTIYDDPKTGNIGWTVYRATSGALVGNIGWRGALSVSRRHGTSTYSSDPVSSDIQQAILCLLSDVCRVDAFPSLQALQQDSDDVLTAPTPYTTRDAAAAAYGLTIPAPAVAEMDSGSLTEHTAIVATGLTSADVSSQTEAQSIVATGLSSADTSTMTDSQSVSVLVNSSDTSSLSSETGAIASTLIQSNDSGLMNEAQSISVHIVINSSDTSSMLDNGTVTVGASHFVDQDFTSTVKTIDYNDATKVVALSVTDRITSLSGSIVQPELIGTATNIGR